MMTNLFAFAESVPSKTVQATGWFLETAWLIPALPALSFFLILFFGKKMKYKGAEFGIRNEGSVQHPDRRTFCKNFGIAFRWRLGLFRPPDDVRLSGDAPYNINFAGTANQRKKKRRTGRTRQLKWSLPAYW